MSTPNRNYQKQLITEIMNNDAKDGLYEVNSKTNNMKTQTAVQWLMANLKYALGGNQAVKGQAILTIDDLNDFEQEALEREDKMLMDKYGEGYDEGVYDALNK